MKEEIDKERIVFGSDETTVPSVRRDLFDKDEQVMRSVIFSYAQKASQDFARIFDGSIVFDNPKSYRDMQRLIEYLTEPDDIVLDFFAGSGTTAHGVLLANRGGEGRRRFVLVQLPEPLQERDRVGQAAIRLCDGRHAPRNIAEITKERVRRVIQELEQEDAGTLDLSGAKMQDRGFRVFRLAESNFTPWKTAESATGDELARQLELHTDHVREGRSANDLLYEILLKSGFPPTTPVETIELAGKSVYTAAEGALVVCLDRELTLELIRSIAERKPERVVCLDEGFAGNDQLKTNAVHIFRSKGVTSFKTV
jgi:adenine-specific DNA-methyltransferase